MATRAYVADSHAVKVDRVIGRAVATMRGNPLVVFGLALVFAGIPAAIVNAASRAMRGPALPDRTHMLGYGVFTLLTGVVGLLFYVLAQAAIVRATTAQAEGRRAGFGECAGAGLRAMVPLIGLDLLLGLAVGAALVFLIVPGVLLFTMWTVANPALVAERIGVFTAFSRSAYLTRGARWKVFGVNLIALVFTWLISSVLGLVTLAGSGLAGFAAMARSGPPLWYLLSSTIIQTLVIAIWATIQTSLYVELRDWKDGPEGAALADVFA